MREELGDRKIKYIVYCRQCLKRPGEQMGGTHVGGIRAGLSEELDLTQTFEGAKDTEGQSKGENGPGRAFKAGECVGGVSSLC